MSLDADYVYEGLLRHNYFPMVKANREDIPPLFTTENYDPDFADDLIEWFNNKSDDISKHRWKYGFDQIEYRGTRYTNVLRLMQIPCPLPYAMLCNTIKSYWDKIDYINSTEHSQIKPEAFADGRLYVFGYGSESLTGRVINMENAQFPNNVELFLKLSTGEEYCAEADVSNCFPSIYSHALPWALVGFEEGKSNRSGKEWFNEFDLNSRILNRQETHGVPIGPGTSNILNEIILARVDGELDRLGYSFIRYIDDYKCYCTTNEKAQAFIRDLEGELNRYLFKLNAKKVRIERLPSPTRSAWISRLTKYLSNEEHVTVRDMVNTLDAAVEMHKQYPEGSVVKYAAKALSRLLSDESVELYCKYLLQLAFHHPVVIPILCDVVKEYQVQLDYKMVQRLLQQQILYRRSDMMSWTIYLMSLLPELIDKAVAKELIRSGDSVAITALYAVGQYQSEVTQYVKAILESELNGIHEPDLRSTLEKSNLYGLDNNWLLIYQLALNGAISTDEFSPYFDTCGLEILRQHEVSFLDRD